MSEKAASVTVYLMEELGDARLRCDQLLRQLSDVTKLVEQSTQRDHLFEVAGHLINSIPETAFKLQKALQAVSLAADRLDYEEIRQDLKPEKVEELERVLTEVRIRPVQHRSQPAGVNMTPSQVAAKLRAIADQTKKQGSVPVSDLVGLIGQMSSGSTKMAAEEVNPVLVLERIATTLETKKGLSRNELVGVLTHFAKDIAFKQADQAVSNPDKELAIKLVDETFDLVRDAKKYMASGHARLTLIKLMGVVDNIATILVNFGSMDATLKAEALVREMRSIKTMIPPKMARYEEGVPADPTENMSPEDAEKWEANTEEYKDKFKTASSEHRDPKVVLSLMKGTVKDLLKARTSVRETAEVLGKINRDATGISYSGNLGDPKLEKLVEGLRKLDSVMSIFDELEGFMVRVFPTYIKKASLNEEKQSRYEEGVPADPTENMSPEDAEKWEANTEEYKNKFKTASFEERVAAYMSRWADSEMPDPEEQLKLMKTHPPTIKEEGEFFVIKLYSPVLRKYIPQGGHRKEEVAEKDLKSWLEAHKESINRLQRQVSKTACIDDKWQV